MYLKLETSGESFALLQLIANDCYKVRLEGGRLLWLNSPSSSLQMGQFFHAAKAFDVLERLDPNPEYWEGKRGACVGVLQLVVAGHEPRESLREVVAILRSTSQPQAELIIMAIRKWARDNRMAL